MESKEEINTTEKLKRLLEKTAQESGLYIKGEVVALKTDEQREAEKEIKEWKEKKTEFHLLKEFKIPQELIKCLFSTNQYDGFLMSGEGGLGKTILAISSVKQNFKTDEWEYTNGYITPLALYEFLYLNRNKKVIIIDDIEGVFNNKLSLSILKGALWDSEGKRICQYSSKSDKAQMPEKFVMNAKIIILCNDIPKENDISTRAMLSRMILYRMKLTFEEKIEICKRFILEEKLEKQIENKVLNILETKVTEATRDFNFRTLRKLIAFAIYDIKKAESLFEATTEIDEDKQAYLRVSKMGLKVSEQVIEFIQTTGRSRRTFFRIKSDIVSQKKDMTPHTYTNERGLKENGK
jgi:hypothetical protein